MASRNVAFIVHPARGGLDQTTAPTLLAPDQLTVAENIEYFTSGARIKRLGTNRYNATAITGAPTITAMADFWRHGTSLSPTQKFVAAAGTDLYKDDGDGVWDSLASGGWGTNTTRAHITLGQGFAIFSNANNNIPKKWDQTTLTDLAATGLPRFEAAIYVARRLWTIGEQTAISGSANPSRMTFTVAGDITDFTGVGSGNFIFDEDDGDRLIGGTIFRGRIYAFKGAQYGSVHEVDGITDPATATRKVLFRGAPCVAHAGIITTPNDIYWPSRLGFHSLEATQKFGDTEEAFISRPIQDLFNGLNHQRLAQIRGFYHPRRNVIGWLCPESGESQNSIALVYNFLLDRWAVWNYTFNTASAMVALTPGNTTPRLYFGGYDGFVRAGDQTTLTDDNGTAYSQRLRTPVHVRLSDELTELHEKQFFSLTSFIKPTGNYSANVEITVDGRAQSATITLGESGGFILDQSQLDVGVLTDSSDFTVVETPIEDVGRRCQVQWTQSGANQQLVLYGHALRCAPAESMALS